jgi:hypothetical protein
VSGLLAKITNITAQDVPGGLFSFAAICPGVDSDRNQEHPLLAFKKTSDPYTLYLHQARQEQDWEDFKVAWTKNTVIKWQMETMKSF